MPVKIRYSPAAESDLDEIWLAIGWNNPNAADRTLDRIRDRVLPLAEFPELGPVRPEIAEGLRFLTEGNYLIIYRNTDNAVEIVRIIHGARDLSDLI